MRQLKVFKHMTVGRHFMHRSEEYLIEGQSRAWVEFSRTQEVEHADSRNLLHCALFVVRSLVRRSLVCSLVRLLVRWRPYLNSIEQFLIRHLYPKP